MDVYATATCHTDGCPSAEIAVEDVCVAMEMDGRMYENTVVCGACGQVITDITDRHAGQPS